MVRSPSRYRRALCAKFAGPVTVFGLPARKSRIVPVLSTEDIAPLFLAALKADDKDDRRGSHHSDNCVSR